MSDNAVDFTKREPPKGPKILVFDIETSPMKLFAWRLGKQVVTIDQVDEDSFMFCWAAQWVGDDHIMCDALPFHEAAYTRSRKDDSRIVRSLWQLFDEADFVTAHNGNGFDVPKVNSRFLMNGMEPPSTYKQIDTLQIARQVFGFSSNKLDFIAQALGVGKKIDNEGWPLWIKCRAGDPEAWENMIEYNKHDVRLLNGVYNAIAPWAKSLPNYGLYVDDDEPMCTHCGSTNLKLDGHHTTTVSKFQAYKCKECGRWLRGRYSVLSLDKKKSLLTNAI